MGLQNKIVFHSNGANSTLSYVETNTDDFMQRFIRSHTYALNRGPYGAFPLLF